jgi:hypothetical protein
MAWQLLSMNSQSTSTPTSVLGLGRDIAVPPALVGNGILSEGSNQELSFTSEATFDNLIAEEGHRRRRRLSLVLMEALRADKRRYRGI